MTTFLKLLALADNDFGDMLAEITPLVYVLFILGVLLCCFEALSPGFEFFGISGVVLLVASIVIYLVQGGEFVVILFMLLIAAVVVGACITIMLVLLKKGKIKSAIFNVGSSVPEGKTEGTRDLNHLLGQVGVAVNFLRPIGDVRFEDDSIVDVVARQGFIDAGAKVKVISVEGQVVKVEQFFED